MRVREREREQYFADTPDYLLIITANDLRGFFQRGRIYTKHEYPELHLFFEILSFRFVFSVSVSRGHINVDKAETNISTVLTCRADFLQWEP